MAEHHAGQGLDLDILESIALGLREIADLLLGKEDVLAVPARQPGQAGLDLRLAQAKIVALPFVELDRHFPHGGIAPLGDVVQRVFHDAADLLIRLCRFGIADAGLQVSRHRVSCLLLRAVAYETASEAEWCPRFRTRP